MAAAITYAPLSYLNEQGQQVAIPVSAIRFEGTELRVSPAYADAESWLRHLASIGLIVPAPPEVAPARPAMVFQAADPGSSGNDIQIEISYPSAESDAFDLTVTWTDVREDLTLDTLPSVLGTDSRPGSRPGLVRVREQAEPLAFPRELSATALEGAGEDTRASLPVPAESGTAFTLEAKDPGEDGGLIQVAISTSPERQTFTLTVTWTKSVSGVTPDNAEEPSKLPSLGYVLAVSSPEEGYALPRRGTFRLRGGVDSRFASNVPAARSA